MNHRAARAVFAVILLAAFAATALVWSAGASSRFLEGRLASRWASTHSPDPTSDPNAAPEPQQPAPAQNPASQPTHHPLPHPRGSAQLQADLLITGGTVVTMDPQRRILEDGAVAVRGTLILAVGPREELEASYVALRHMDARGRLVLPGFVNAHTHAPMSLLRGLANDLTLEDWLTNHIFPAEKLNVTEDFSVWGTRLAALEMIEGGITTFADMYYFEDAVAREAKAAGLRGVLGESVIDFPVPDSSGPDQSLAQIEKFLERWHADPLIHPAVAPHSPYTCSADTLRRAAALARRFHAPLLIHVAETRHEREESLQKKQLSPVAWLDSIGFLGPDVTAAHCVWVDDADMKLLAARGVGCVHNPSSNAMLASGVAPVPAMLAAGVRLGLGTDGPAGSNNDLDLMQEMDLAAKLQKVSRLDPRALTAAQALEMATLGGARALHLEDQIGSLEPGKQADIILLRTETPHGVPAYDVPAQIVYSLKASDVETVIVAGRILMESGRVLSLDRPTILQQAREYSEKVRQSLVPAVPR
ncbi:MAG TPA: amidohydrolase [Candidatus Acidoferrales bacterium]|nr:amidohydrolase [Candidatus Acidoferrales bacterium]